MIIGMRTQVFDQFGIVPMQTGNLLAYPLGQAFWFDNLRKIPRNLKVSVSGGHRIFSLILYRRCVRRRVHLLHSHTLPSPIDVTEGGRNCEVSVTLSLF